MPQSTTSPVSPRIHPIVSQGEANIDRDVKCLPDDIARKLTTTDEMHQAPGDLINKVTANKLPILKFPPEILGEIFIACLPSHPGPNRNEAPLLVCRICSGWRTVALSTPELWSFIYITHRKQRLNEEMLSAWLTRSGDCPLSIDLRLFRTAHIGTMTSLIPYSHRWRNLELAMVDIKPFLDAEISSLLSLQSLTLGPLGNEDNIIELSPLLESASRLRSIDWHCQTDIRILNLPWTQLSRLHHHGRLCVPEWLGILVLCPQLVDVHLGAILPWNPSLAVPEWRGSPVVLKHLRSFCVTRACDLGWLSENLITPVLQDLELHGPESDGRYPNRAPHGPDWDSQWPVLPVLSFLSNAGHILRRLCLGYSNFAEATFIKMMTLTPSLVEISLSVKSPPPMITDQTMRALTVRNGDLNASCLLPKLEIIRLHGRLDFTTDTFVTMITSRCRAADDARVGGSVPNPRYPAARLMIADVEFSDAINESAVAVLKGCLDAGLEFPRWLEMVEGPSYHLDKLGEFFEY